MSDGRKLSPKEVERIRDGLGRDLRVEEAAARRSRSNKASDSEVAVTPKPEPIPHRLPPVGGRHTEVLEHVNPYSEAAARSAAPSAGPAAATHLSSGVPAIRRPSLDDTPIKKPKLEPLDVEMLNFPEDTPPGSHPPNISPGEPIPSTAEDSEHDKDVDIPVLEQAGSPSFASQAREIPNGHPFHSLREPQHIDLTKQDDLLGETGPDDDELSQASQAPHPAAAAGLLKFLNSEAPTGPNSTNPAGFPNSMPAPVLHASAPALPIPNSGLAPGICNSAQHAAPNTAYQAAPQHMPPWLVDIHQGLQSLHSKADQQYNEISTCLQTHGTRILHLESVSAEHTTQQQRHDVKLKQLENKVQELQAAFQDGSRSPRRAPSAPRSPRSPRSPRFSTHEFRDEEDEPNLDIIIGGWLDARRDDAIQEAKNILQDAQIPMSDVDEIWSPYSRTNFVKLRLLFDPKDPRELSLSAKRSKQNRVLEKLKSKKYVSGVSGSENQRIWATRSKTPEERIRTRAIVLTKEFFSNLPDLDPTKPNPFPPSSIDIVWTGKLFVGRFQVLGYLHRDGEPLPYDFLLSDSRGNHTEWYIKASAFEGVTGRKQEDLQACWDQYGPSGRPE